MSHSRPYLNLRRDVNNEAANWNGTPNGPVDTFLACIVNFTSLDTIATIAEPNLGLRELEILGRWLVRASSLSTTELEELYLDLTGFEDRRE